MQDFLNSTVIPQLLLMAALQDVHQPGIGYLRRKWKDKGLSTWQRLTEVEKILAETLGHQLDPTRIFFGHNVHGSDSKDIYSTCPPTQTYQTLMQESLSSL